MLRHVIGSLMDVTLLSVILSLPPFYGLPRNAARLDTTLGLTYTLTVTHTYTCTYTHTGELQQDHGQWRASHHK